MSIKIANTVVISDTKDLDNLNNAEFEDNGFITLPSGNTAQRPVSPSGGMLRYNTDINDFEMYSNDEWTVFEEDTENLKDSIKYDEASVNVNFPAAFQITDYDIEREYVLTSNTGTVTRDEDVITFTANTTGTAGFTINGREISIQSIDTPIAPVGAIAPYTGSLPADGSWVDYTEGLSKYILGASDNISVNTNSEKDYTIIQNVGEGYNITSSGLTNSLGVSNEGDIYFKPNGLALYVLADNLVQQYDLSIPWDLDSLSQTGTFFDLQSEITDNDGISFKPDGTKMYVLGTTTNVASRVFQYTLSTPWDVSTASYDSVEFIADQGLGPGGMFFKPDGLNLFVVSNYDTSNRKVVDYSLSTAWDLSTASTSGSTSLLISSYVSTGLTFSSDGKVLFLVESDDIVQFTLSTAWDLSTASFYSDTDVSSSSYLGVTIKSDDTKLYAINSSAEIQELVLSGGVTTNTNGSHTGSSYTYTSGSSSSITGTFVAGAHSHTVTISSIDSNLKRKSYKLAKCVSASPLPSNIYILSDSNLSGLSSVDVEETHMLLNSSSESSGIDGNNTIIITLTTNSAGSHAHGGNGTPVYSGSEPYYRSDSSDGSHFHTATDDDANDNTKKRTFSLWSDVNETVGVISGSIMLWDSDTPPAGWVICDGTNGTPDMRDRYLSISNTASHGVSTGDNVVTFSGLTTSGAGSHRHYSGEGGTVGDPTQSGRHINFIDTHSHTINTFSARIRPEYHALHFIKKL